MDTIPVMDAEDDLTIARNKRIDRDARVARYTERYAQGLTYRQIDDRIEKSNTFLAAIFGDDLPLATPVERAKRQRSMADLIAEDDARMSEDERAAADAETAAYEREEEERTRREMTADELARAEALRIAYEAE